MVMAVVLTVTLPLAGAQAAPVGAAELIGAAGWVLCVGEGTMRLLPWAPVQAQLGRAPPPGAGLTALGGLIRAVRTVPVMVTHKMLGNAEAVLAHEFAVVTGAIVYWGQRQNPLSPLYKLWMVPGM